MGRVDLHFGFESYRRSTASSGKLPTGVRPLETLPAPGTSSHRQNRRVVCLLVDGCAPQRRSRPQVGRNGPVQPHFFARLARDLPKRPGAAQRSGPTVPRRSDAAPRCPWSRCDDFCRRCGSGRRGLRRAPGHPPVGRGGSRHPEGCTCPQVRRRGSRLTYAAAAHPQRRQQDADPRQIPGRLGPESDDPEPDRGDPCKSDHSPPGRGVDVTPPERQQRRGREARVKAR